MADQDGKTIAQGVRANAAAFRKACEVLNEENSSRAPEGRWSPKQIISHLCGPEGKGLLPTLKAFVEQDTPELDIKPEDPYWSGKRRSLSLAELLAEFEGEYERMASFVEGLSEAQLSRKAHIPMLRESPLGEYPTLAQWAGALSDYHLGFHHDHMREIEQALGLKNA